MRKKVVYQPRQEVITINRAERPGKLSTYTPPPPYRIFRVLEGGRAPRPERNDKSRRGW